MAEGGFVLYIGSVCWKKMHLHHRRLSDGGTSTRSTVDCCGEMVSGKDGQGISSFCAKFLSLSDDFSKECAEGTAELSKIIKYGKHLGENEEKPCSSCLQTIFRLIPGIRKSDLKNYINIRQLQTCESSTFFGSDIMYVGC